MTGLSKIMRRDSGERLVHVMILDEKEATYVPFTFHTSVIEGVAGTGNGRSVLSLVSGRFITVFMAYADLVQKIYYGDFRESEIDLRDVTGISAKIQIRAPLREPDTLNVSKTLFTEDEIESIEEFTSKYGRSTSSLRMTFTAAAQKRLRLPEGKTPIIDMPRRDFLNAISATKDSGGRVIDICSIFDRNKDLYGCKPH